MIAILIFLQFSLADSLYVNGYYKVAQTEYEREFFFYPELKNNSLKRYRFTVSLLETNDDKGIKELNNMIQDFPDLEPEIKNDMAKYYVKLGNYYQASELLSQTENKKMLGFVYLLNNKFADAREFFKKNGNYEVADEIDEYIRAPKKSIATATLLSFICPGAGQIYAGNAKQGILDFVLNFGSGYLIYNAIKQEKYVDVGLIFTFLFHRFYIGSIHNAQKSVIDNNKWHREKWLNHMKIQYFNDIGFEY